MIVLDSSALIAILEREADAARFAASIAAAARIFMSAVNVHETGVVLRVRRGPEGVERMWQFLDGNGVQIVPFDVEQARAALRGFDRYGKGLNARARLNLADCASYALAKTSGLPLLFKGDDFPATDVAFCL